VGQISNERRRVRGTQCNHPPAAPQHRSPPPIARRAPQPSSTVCWRAGQGGGSPKVDGADAQAGPEAEREHRPLSFPPTRVRGQRGRPEGLRSRELPALGEQSFPRRGALPRAPMCAKLEAMCPSLLTRPGWSVRLRGAFGTIWRFPVDRPSPEKRASDLGGWPMAESAAQVGYSAHVMRLWAPGCGRGPWARLRPPWATSGHSPDLEGLHSRATTQRLSSHAAAATRVRCTRGRCVRRQHVLQNM
jgi:hypothetical protein